MTFFVWLFVIVACGSSISFRRDYDGDLFFFQSVNNPFVSVIGLISQQRLSDDLGKERVKAVKVVIFPTC